jgi:hypothetical protein
MRESRDNSVSRCVRGIETARLAAAHAAHKDCGKHRYDGTVDQDGKQEDVEVHLARALLLPTGLGGLTRAGAPLGGGQLRRPSRTALDPSKMPARNRRRVLLVDRLGGSLTSRQVNNGLGALVGIAGHRGSLHAPRIAGGDA